jgi:hypothetical protein
VIGNLANPENISTDTMTFNIKPVTADEITIVLRQKDYIYDTVISNDKLDEVQELWNMALGLAKESYINDTVDVSRYADNNVYQRYIDAKEDEITTWNENFIRGGE